jgi:hypothetical protein
MLDKLMGLPMKIVLALGALWVAMKGISQTFPLQQVFVANPKLYALVGFGIGALFFYSKKKQTF